LVPSHIDFCNIEAELAGKKFSEKIFVKLLQKHESNFDYCFLDCPPSLGIITVNALVASDYILIPVEAEFYSWQGLDSIFQAIRVVEEGMESKKFLHNDQFQNIGAFLAKVKNTRSITNGIRLKAKENLGGILYASEIRENVAICESQINGQDIFSYDSQCNGAKDYKKLIAELEKN
jgi:chromosome partitioning protein